MEVKYIFGIIEAAQELFNLCGTDAYEEVYTIPYREISAAVMDSPFVDYTTLPKDQCARYLLRHQQVIEKIMDSYTIVPMKLGTYALNRGEVEEILSRGYRMARDILMKINNKIEMDVVATWADLNSMIREIGNRHEILELKKEIMKRPEGVSVKDQMKVGGIIKNILDMERMKLAVEIEAALKKCSIYSKCHDLMDDSMIFNYAFLIERFRKEEFERILDELNNRFDKRINFRSVGPLPTYSFYTIETKKVSFKEVDGARKMLGLGNRATEEEIISAYRNSAKLYHPDKNLGLPNAERRFNEINRSYRILLEYCLSAGGAVEEDACSFNEKEFSQNAFIVQVRG